MSFALVGVTFWEGARIAAVAIAFYYIAVIVLQPQPLISILYQSAWMLTTTLFAGLGFYFPLDRTQRDRLAEATRPDRRAGADTLPAPQRAAAGDRRAQASCRRKPDRRHPRAQASLLFADVVGFTPLSSRFLLAQVAVAMLNAFSMSSVSTRSWRTTGWRRSRPSAIATWWRGRAAEAQPEPPWKRLTSAAVEMQAEAAKVQTPDGQPLALGDRHAR